ncbi:MAG: hypothetical protein J5835_00740 [Bacteroidales bacterium]|nr:hypothetical protein [Bacteroidales bacterium]
MKKIFTYITITALAAAIIGCAKETDTPDAEFAEKVALAETVSGEEVTFILSVPESPDTKTALGTKDGSSYPISWSDGDQNLVTLNGTAPTASTKDSDTQISASFKPTAGLSVYNFLYRGDAGHDNQVTLPAAQSYVANGFDAASMPMYAASASRSNTVTFNALCSLLKFSITGEKKIDSVTLTAADGSKSLSGTFTIGKTSNLLNGTLTPASGGGAINYNFGSHIQLSDTPFVFYVAIPAGTYEGGITLNIVDNASGHMTATVMNTNATKTIAAGKVREFNNIVYVPDVEVNLHQIYNVATFQSFVSAVAGGKKTLNARLTQNAATLDLSSIAGSFASIEDYKGIFDGNGKTISFGTTTATQPLFATLQGVVKNLTLTAKIEETDPDKYEVGMFARRVQPSNEVDDIAGLQNCTANGSVTYTPSGAVSGNACVGGMVGNNKGGSFANCTNNATVTFANNGSSTVHDMQPSIGGVVGRTQKGGDLSTQGDISNCTNAGTVVCDAKLRQGIYLGGVLGYQVEKAESISGCTNSGLVKATASCSTTGPLQIGGVIGMGKGSIESCSNLAAGTVTTEACSVGTYLCQGGVIGRMNATSGTYSGLSNAGTVNVAATGASTQRHIGGVAGRCNEGAAITEFTNSGNINYTAVDANETWIGGIVACSTNHELTNCTSTGGTLTYSGETTHGNLYVGGIVGKSEKNITSCSNAMTINVTGTMSCDNNTYKGFGGVVGHMTGANITVTNCTNTGAINYGQTITDEGQTYVGGLVGVLTKGEISGGGNSGTFTFSGQNTKRSPSIGGVVGRVMSNETESGYALSNNVTNSGAIVLNSSVSGSQYLFVGGLVGQHGAGNIYGTNSGSITVTEVHESMMALGGLVGLLAGGSIVSGSANTETGDIALNGWTSGYHSYIGGIVGEISSGSTPTASSGGTVTGATNAGDITMGSGCVIPRNNYIGGIAGYAGNTISSCSNSGNIVNNYTKTAKSYTTAFGGVVGYGAAALTSCSNSGNVTNNGATYDDEINIAGVVGILDGADLTSCYNEGTVSNTATSGTSSKQDMQLGGVIGNNKGGNTITSCYNTGEITNSGAGAKISMGGLVGWSSASTTYTSTCYNTGNLTNTGTGSSNPGLCMGGLLGVARGANTLTGTASVYNYNEGLLTDDSATLNLAMGGICGNSDNAASSFNYCKSIGPEPTSQDDIWIKNNTRNKVYVGGIIGRSEVASTMDYASNTSDIVFVGNTFSATGQVFAGGIIGGWTASGEQTITGCSNTGWVYTLNSDHSDLAAGDTKTPLWSCYGGIAGMGAGTSEGLNGGFNTITGKTFTNCTNSGTVQIYCQGRFCIGGIVAYTENDISGCTCTGNITGHTSGGIGTVNNNYHRNITGGVVGLFTGSTITNSKYNATLNTNGSSPFSYDGGIIGYAYTGSITLNTCKVGGSTRGAGSGAGRSAVMVGNSTNSVTYTFTNCYIKKKTISYATGSKVTLSSDSDITEGQCFGGGASGYTFNGDLPTIADSI